MSQSARLHSISRRQIRTLPYFDLYLAPNHLGGRWGCTGNAAMCHCPAVSVFTYIFSNLTRFGLGLCSNERTAR